MAIRLTAHARRRLAERKISEEWVERTVAAPDWRSPEPSDPRLTRAYKRVPEAAGRVLRVVYLLLSENEFLIITAFPDRDAQPPDPNHVG
jgi:hypothetical protein